MLACMQMLMPQTVLHASCTGIRATLIIRFLRDVSFFADRCMEVSSAIWPAREPTSGSAPLDNSYRTLIEVSIAFLSLHKEWLAQHQNFCKLDSFLMSCCALACSKVTLRDVVVDVPRHSWSDDFLRLVCCNVAVVTPALASFSETAHPNMEGWTPAAAQMPGGSSSAEGLAETSVSGLGVSGSTETWEPCEGPFQSGEHPLLHRTCRSVRERIHNRSIQDNTYMFSSIFSRISQVTLTLFAIAIILQGCTMSGIITGLTAPLPQLC